MRKSIFALGLALALVGLGFTNVSAVETDSGASSNSSATTSEGTSTSSSSTNTGSTDEAKTTKTETATEGATTKETTTGTEETPTFDTSKVTASSTSLRTALIDSLNHVATITPTTENDVNLQRLLGFVRQGYTISAKLNVKVHTEIEVSETVNAIIAEQTSGRHIALISTIDITVEDPTKPGETISITNFYSPVSVTIPVFEEIKAQLSTRAISVLRIHQTSAAPEEYESGYLPSASFDSDNNVVFNTKDFSYFIVTYTGDEISTYVVDDGDDVAVPSTDGGVAVPNTAGFLGLELTVFHLLMLTGISLVVIALVAYAVKRAYIRNKISLK